MNWKNNYTLTTPFVYAILCVIIVISINKDWWVFATAVLFLLVHVMRDAWFRYFPFGHNHETFCWHAALSVLAVIGAAVFIWRGVHQITTEFVAGGAVLCAVGTIILAGHGYALVTKKQQIYVH